MPTDIENVRAFLAQAMGEGGAPGDFATSRVAYDGWGAGMPLPEGLTVTPVRLAHCEAERLVPAGADESRAILYLHGGGYCIGSAVSHRHLAAQLAKEAGCPALIIDYRLAPEHPFPAAVDDAVAGFLWLQASGLNASRIAIAGDSAGGGLTIATALALKARGLPQPGGLFGISPWVNLAQTGASYAAIGPRDPIVGAEGLTGMATAYAGQTPINHAMISPIHGDLTGLAPLLIHVGQDEVLLSDSVRLAEVAGIAGVDVTLKIAPQMIHVWHFFHAMLGEARAANAEAGAWIRHRTGG